VTRDQIMKLVFGLTTREGGRATNVMWRTDDRVKAWPHSTESLWYSRVHKQCLCCLCDFLTNFF
jgi:hypothetical protein